MRDNHKNNITFIFVVPSENCKTQNTHHPTFSILGWETCPLVSNINSRSTPPVLRHLNRRCSALSSAFLCVKITLCQTVHHRLLNRTATTMCFFSLHPHSITPHLLPFFFANQREELLIGERNGITWALDLDLSIIRLLSPSIILYLALSCPILTPEWG